MKFYVKLDRVAQASTITANQASFTGMASALMNGYFGEGVNIENFDLMQLQNAIGTPPVIPQSSTPVFYVLDNLWRVVPMKISNVTQVLKFMAKELLVVNRPDLIPLPGSVIADTGGSPLEGWESVDTKLINPPQFSLFVRTSNASGGNTGTELTGSSYNLVARSVDRDVIESVTSDTKEFAAYQGRRAWVSQTLGAAFPERGVNYISPAITAQGITSEWQMDFQFGNPIAVAVNTIMFYAYHSFYMEVEVDNAALEVNNPQRPGLPPDAWLIFPQGQVSRDYTQPVFSGSSVPSYHKLMGLPQGGPTQLTQPVATCPISYMASVGGMTGAFSSNMDVPFYAPGVPPWDVDTLGADVTSAVHISPSALNPFKDLITLDV